MGGRRGPDLRCRSRPRGAARSAGRGDARAVCDDDGGVHDAGAPADAGRAG